MYTLPEDTPFPEATDEPRQCGWISALQSVHRPSDVVEYIGHPKTTRLLQRDKTHRTADGKRHFQQMKPQLPEGLPRQPAASLGGMGTRLLLVGDAIELSLEGK